MRAVEVLLRNDSEWVRDTLTHVTPEQLTFSDQSSIDRRTLDCLLPEKPSPQILAKRLRRLSRDGGYHRQFLIHPTDELWKQHTVGPPTNSN